MQEISEKIVSIISDILKVEKGKVTLQSIFESLVADDLDKIEILIKIEEEFNITILDNDFLVFGTVGTIDSLADYIEMVIKTKK
jgi:acyl carrier protein